MPNKFKSRKFWLAILGQITGIAALCFPDHATGIEAAMTNVGALLLMALTAMGFIAGESAIDRAAVQSESQERVNKGFQDVKRARQEGFEEGFDKGRKADTDTPTGTTTSAAILLCITLFLGGCVTGVPVRPTKTYTDTIGKKWIQYVEADDQLTEVEKETHKTFHRDFKALVDDIHQGTR